MPDPFIGEIRVFSFGYAPRNWALCNGQILAITQNQALFSLLGTTYGGDGVRTFALPDLRGRVPLHPNDRYTLGQIGGEATHVLNLNEMPAGSHTHALNAASGSGSRGPATGNLLASTNQIYVPSTSPTPMNGGAISQTGGQGHENMQPYLAVNFSIALNGIFPSRG